MAKKGKEAVQIQAGGSISEYIDPESVLIESNIRFGLKESRIESLAADILEKGEVMVPVEVELLETPQNGHKYRMVDGAYRLTAVNKLNKEQGAGLKLPAIIKPSATSAVDRLKRQISHNVQLETMSPLDTAIAIKQLLDAGVSRTDVRAIFSRPGGRKGAKVQIASNSFINMHLSFLDLPKAIQGKIHEGLVGVAAAYQLTKVPADQRTKVLEKAEAERQKSIEAEEREEERLLKQQAAAEETAKKREAAKVELAEAEAILNTAKGVLKEATAVCDKAYEAKKHPPSVTARKEAVKAFNEAEAARSKAQSETEKAQEKYDMLNKRYTESETLAAEKAKRLADLRKGATASSATKKGAAVGAGDVQKAAKDAGVETSGAVPLNAGEIRKIVTLMSKTEGIPKLAEVGKQLLDCFMGETTEHQMRQALIALLSD